MSAFPVQITLRERASSFASRLEAETVVKVLADTLVNGHRYDIRESFEGTFQIVVWEDAGPAHEAIVGWVRVTDA